MTSPDLGHRAGAPASVAVPARLLGAALCLVLAAGCRHAPAGFDLRSLVAAGRFTVAGGTAANGTPANGSAANATAAGGTAPEETAPNGASPSLVFAARPQLADVEVDHERRPVVLTSAAPWSWTGQVPPHAELHAGVQLVPAARPLVRRLQAVVTLRSGHETEVLQAARSGERVDPLWLDLSADLERYAGRRVTLQFAVTLADLPRASAGANLVAWGPVALTAAATGPGSIAPTSATSAAGGAAGRAGTAGAGPAGGTARPNILMILVDTLRRDRLTPYGYGKDTTPEMARWLAERGTVAEDAYSQAPWTLPSVVSLFTGRYPGELLGSDLASYGVPPRLQPLAERLAAAGFVTAGFLANPTLHVGAGFERGFQTFYAPPADVEWLRRHAEDVNRHALPWIAAHQDGGRPFFLYLHYIDPHDPYDNPDVVGNHSPFDDGNYTGPVAGDWVHGVYSGKIVLPDPPRDIAHLSALYDAEVHYVDRYVGQVLASLRPAVLANTLVVLTADHGEELFDHGGWKHGQTLYDEQIHVPLLWRWDGHIAAGRRLAGTVRLLDVAPTLAAAAGAPPDPGWEGANLLPALTGAAPLAERPAFSQGLSGGPLRAAAVLGHEKLIVFNHEEPFQPGDALQDHLWRQDLARLRRVEHYDLAADPRERHDLAAASTPNPGAGPATGPAGSPAAAPAGSRLPLLAAVIERRLDRCLSGLRLYAAGIPAGSTLRLDLTLARPPHGWTPYLLGAADHAVVAGGHLVLDLAGGDWLVRGVRIDDDAAGVVALAATLDGRPLPPGQVRVGAGAPYAGGALNPAALRTRDWPAVLDDATAAPFGGAGAAGAAGKIGPVVGLWLHDTTGELQRPTAHDPETERRLRALGYIE